MKLYRYMSIEEFVKISTGMDMKAYHSHFDKVATSSEGFCFIGETTHVPTIDGETIEFTPQECLQFLDSIVDAEVLVEFEADDEIDIKEGWGRYTNPFVTEMMRVKEYSLMEYTEKTLIPKRYIFNPQVYDYNNVWEEFSKEKDYDIRELINKLFSERMAKNENIRLDYGRNSNNFKFLPSVPNTDKNEVWRVHYDDSNKIFSLVYGNPITEVNRYELKFDEKSKAIVINEPIPEFWNGFEKFYDSNYELANNPRNLLMIAALVAVYPQFQETFCVDFEDSLLPRLKVNDPNQSCILNLSSTSLSQKEDGSIDIIIEDDETRKNISLLDIMEQDKPNLEMRRSEKIAKKEEWNVRLGMYIEKINAKTFTKQDVPKLLDDLFGQYQEEADNPIRSELKSRLDEIKGFIAEYYECNEDEVCIGNYMCGFDDIMPYVVILGNLDFDLSELLSLEKLRFIAGNADFSDSCLTSIGSLEYIGGKVNWGKYDKLRKQYVNVRKNIKERQISSSGTEVEERDQLENELMTNFEYSRHMQEEIDKKDRAFRDLKALEDKYKEEINSRTERKVF